MFDSKLNKDLAKYLAACFGLLQFADILINRSLIPDGSIYLLLIITLLGSLYLIFRNFTKPASDPEKSKIHTNYKTPILIILLFTASISNIFFIGSANKIKKLNQEIIPKINSLIDDGKYFDAYTMLEDTSLISENFPDLFNSISDLRTIESNPTNADVYYSSNSLDDNKEYLLRTHTSPVQVRTMLGGKPPFKIIAPGRTYRSDSDQTHAPMFHQVEGLHIDKNINMGHLKGCLNYFIKEFFEIDKIKMRFRPSHFPFTEPSAEVDIGYRLKDGKIIIGEGDKWLEILGCGMVHPNVLKNAKVNPKTYQGYAFGVGIDRLAMLKYGINDLRAFFESDIRWLEFYGFDPLDVPTNYRGLSR